MTEHQPDRGARRRVVIDALATGVPGLDEVLGGGLPEYAFTLIAGAPGAGKTTLAQQVMFANASRERPALYFTVLGEPPLKLLRYQQQFTFFDPDRLGDAVRFVNLNQELLEQDLGALLERMEHEVRAAGPGLVVVDSFRSVARVSRARGGGELQLVDFVQRLAVYLTSWQATTFLVGEYLGGGAEEDAVGTVADGILWLTQNVDRNSVVRKLQVVKMRGRAHLPGLHTFRIGADGLEVFPRILRRQPPSPPPPEAPARLGTGVAGLDELLGGGLPAGAAVLVAGPAGSGKSTLATQFVAAGLRRGEPAAVAVFEERPREYLARADQFGLGLSATVAQGRLEVLYLRPLDLSVDEALLEIQTAVARVGAQRLVIDSLSGFELALAPTFREDFRESLYRMVGALTGAGVTVFMTVEVAETFTDLPFSPHLVSFLTDVIIRQRYVELDGRLRRVLTVVKMRRGAHSTDLCLYDVGPTGVVVGAPLRGWQGVITGVPTRVAPDGAARPPGASAYPGLTAPETVLLRELEALGAARAAALGRPAGLRRAPLGAALERLVALRYAVRDGEGGRAVYRPAAAGAPPPEGDGRDGRT
jgi:circadian clock protein KaiC